MDEDCFRQVQLTDLYIIYILSFLFILGKGKTAPKSVPKLIIELILLPLIP